MAAVPDRRPSGPRAEAAVDLAAVRHNVAVLATAASGAALMAVVKAEGYGHGAVPVGRAALEAGATWLGVCTLEEALELRSAGIDAPVLSWLHLPDEDFAPAVGAGIDLSVSSRAHLAAVLLGARRAGRPARLHLKIDTGLGRNGAPRAQWSALLDDAATAQAAGVAEVVAVWSHLAHGDVPGHPMLDEQAARLTSAWQAAVDRGLTPIRHLANSAATLTRPDLHFDLVRPGVAVYGLDPLHRPVGQSPLRPAMTLAARVALVKRVPAGEGVSYGHAWTAPTETTLALVPVGYADGVPRRLNTAGRMRVLLGGRLRPVVGRVCMDQVVVDCGPDGGWAAVGDRAVLFGPGDHGEPTAQDWADELETIHYEVVTAVHGRRVRRVVVDGGLTDSSLPGAAVPGGPEPGRPEPGGPAASRPAVSLPGARP
jgi:alanine racemase